MKNIKEEIARLERYADRLQNDIRYAKTPAHADFFNRDLKKTLAKIQSLKVG